MKQKLSDSRYVNNQKSNFIIITYVYNNRFDLFCAYVLMCWSVHRYCFPSPLQIALLTILELSIYWLPVVQFH